MHQLGRLVAAVSCLVDFAESCACSVSLAPLSPTSPECTTVVALGLLLEILLRWPVRLVPSRTRGCLQLAAQRVRMLPLLLLVPFLLLHPARNGAERILRVQFLDKERVC